MAPALQRDHEIDLPDNVVRPAAGADVLAHEAIDLAAPGTLPAASLDHLELAHTAVTGVGAVAEAARCASWS